MKQALYQKHPATIPGRLVKLFFCSLALQIDSKHLELQLCSEFVWKSMVPGHPDS